MSSHSIYLSSDSMTLLSEQEYQRYARHFNLPNFGLDAQLKLKDSKVLVVGVGGLGSPVLLYLAAAGIGTIGIIDPDIVSLSNLQRQILYSQDSIDQSKVKLAARQARSINPHIKVNTYKAYLDNGNALDIIMDYDIVVDGTDNFPTRYLVNDACVILGKPNVYASIYQFEGQVSVFNYQYEDGSRGPHYRDIYPEPPAPGLVPDCATGGVLGVLAGIVGTQQALEVIKVATGIGEPIAGKLLLYDALTSQTRIIKLQNKSHTEVSHLVNYQDFCGVVPITKEHNSQDMKEITVQELKQWKDEGKDFQLVDVREQHEYDFANLGGELIPLGDIMARSEEVSTEKEVVLMCRSGQRSGAALGALQQQGDYNLYNLKGGYLAWANEIDTSLPRY